MKTLILAAALAALSAPARAELLCYNSAECARMATASSPKPSHGLPDDPTAGTSFNVRPDPCMAGAQHDDKACAKQMADVAAKIERDRIDGARAYCNNRPTTVGVLLCRWDIPAAGK
jgi:hypothetical protein